MTVILGEFIAWLFLDIFWLGLCYVTGGALVLVFSFGKVQPGKWGREEEKYKAKSHSPFSYSKGRKHFMFASTVAMVGLAFWVLLVGLISIALKTST